MLITVRYMMDKNKDELVGDFVSVISIALPENNIGSAILTKSFYLFVNPALNFIWGLRAKRIHLLLQEMQLRSLGQEGPLKRKWQPTQCSYLTNPIDRGAW